jgi:hypothetical protein
MCPHPHESIRAAWGLPLTLRYTAAALAQAAATDSVAERLFEQILYQAGRRSAPAEVRSWKRSLPVLAQDLVDAGLSDVEVLVEYQLPLTSQRADVVLAGVHPDTQLPSYVVVELKQWTSAHQWEDDPNLVEVDGQPGGPRSHPVRQVRNYCTHIIDFARTLRGDEGAVAGAAYLHNATSRDTVADLFNFRPDLHGQLFIGRRRVFLQASRLRQCAKRPRLSNTRQAHRRSTSRRRRAAVDARIRRTGGDRVAHR